MKRRFVLAGATASLMAVAGCLRDGQGGETDDSDNGGSADSQKNDSSTQSDDNDESETLDCDIRNRREQGKADAIETSVSNTDDSCGIEAARAAVAHVENQLNTEFNSSWGRPGYFIRAGDESGEARVNLFAIRNTEGEFVVCPPLPFNEVVGATPAEVTVTITAEAGDDEECTREIYVNQSIERED